MKESWRNIGDLIAEPTAAFTRLKSEPRYGLPVIVFYVFNVLLLWALMPYTGKLMSDAAATQGATPAQFQNFAHIMQWVIVFLGPIIALLALMLISVILRGVVRVLLKNETLKFKHIYAANLHIALISCIIQLVNTALLLVFKDVADVSNRADLKMIPGLHMLFDSETLNVKVLDLLSYINPLNLWVIAVMAIAITVLTDIKKARAWVAAIILWVLSAGFEVIIS